MEIRMIMNVGKTPRVLIIESPEDHFMDKEQAIYEALDQLGELLNSMKKEEREG